MLLPALERAGSEKPAISENPAISEKPAIIQQLGTPDKAPREARVDDDDPIVVVAAAASCPGARRASPYNPLVARATVRAGPLGRRLASAAPAAPDPSSSLPTDIPDPRDLP